MHLPAATAARSDPVHYPRAGKAPLGLGKSYPAKGSERSQSRKPRQTALSLGAAVPPGRGMALQLGMERRETTVQRETEPANGRSGEKLACVVPAAEGKSVD
jgi:hypothetical protein